MELERIKTLVKWIIGAGYANNQKEVGELLGYSNESSFSQILNGKKPLPSTFINKLLLIDKKINKDWIISGSGVMIKTTNSNAKPLDDVEYMEIPLVPVSARAGYLSEYGDEEFIGNLPTLPVIVDKHYNGKYRIFEVDGDSMDNGLRDSICDKDKILCREIKHDLWQYKLHIQDWYFVIVHKDEGVIVKQIISHDTEKCEIQCHSLNPLFRDFTLHLNDVVELYNVIKIVDRNTRI